MPTNVGPFGHSKVSTSSTGEEEMLIWGVVLRALTSSEPKNRPSESSFRMLRVDLNAGHFFPRYRLFFYEFRMREMTQNSNPTTNAAVPAL